MSRGTSFDWREFAGRPIAVFAVWTLYCLVRLALLPFTEAQPQGPDDWMRLFEVRDLLAGQSWFDVTQYRADPPNGASMHWSRLVDLPLAAVAMIAGLFVPDPKAEMAAMIVVPMLYLLPVLWALRAIMQRLGFAPLALALGLVALPLFPLLLGNFSPFRIDHHTPQAVLGLVCAALLLQPSRRATILSGVCAAAWMVISLEGLPMVAVLAGVYGLLYWLEGDRRMVWFLGALAVAAPLLSLTTRPMSGFAEAFCDILAPGHMAAFAAAALIAALLPVLPKQTEVHGRLLALFALPVFCLPIAFVTLGECAANPFSTLDPLLQQYWYSHITEGLPIWRQITSVATMLVWTLAVAILGVIVMRKNAAQPGARALPWLAYSIFAVAACFYSLWLMRAVILAQMLVIPFAAYLLADFLPKARAVKSSLPRIAATLGCFLLATPIFAGALVKQLVPSQSAERTDETEALDSEPCDLSRLTALPQGHILAPLDDGPEILGKTGHTVVMASYHRNQARMGDVIAAYVGSPEQAQVIARANGVDYVLACASKADVALYRSADPDNFANALVNGETPDWLEPAQGFEDGNLRVYRVKNLP